MSMIDEINVDMWKSAKERGRTKPGYHDFMFAVRQHHPSPVIQMQIQPNGWILLRLADRSTPSLTMRVENDVLITESATKPDKHTTGYRTLMEGMDA